VIALGAQRKLTFEVGGFRFCPEAAVRLDGRKGSFGRKSVIPSKTNRTASRRADAGLRNLSRRLFESPPMKSKARARGRWIADLRRFAAAKLNFAPLRLDVLTSEHPFHRFLVASKDGVSAKC
jgi:hypothetical protein